MKFLNKNIASFAKRNTSKGLAKKGYSCGFLQELGVNTKQFYSSKKGL